MGRDVACPVCRKQAAFDTGNPWRPFCSERCKTIDLGDWAANRHVIAADGERPSGGEDEFMAPTDRSH